MNDAEATVPTTVFLSAHSWIERIMNRPCARLRGTAIRAALAAVMHHLMRASAQVALRVIASTYLVHVHVDIACPHDRMNMFKGAV